jgi:hypothetical protein
MQFGTHAPEGHAMSPRPLTNDHARLLSWDFASEHRETRSLANWARRWTRFIMLGERPVNLNTALLIRPMPSLPLAA